VSYVSVLGCRPDVTAHSPRTIMGSSVWTRRTRFAPSSAPAMVDGETVAVWPVPAPLLSTWLDEEGPSKNKALKT